MAHAGTNRYREETRIIEARDIIHAYDICRYKLKGVKKRKGIIKLEPLKGEENGKETSV